MKTADSTAIYPHRLALPLQQESTPNSNRVLIIDDEAFIRSLLEKILSGAGYSTRAAKDGEEGWSALCSESFDLVITDHEMPQLTGLDLLRRLRKASGSLPVILISGQMPWETPDLLSLLQPGAAIPKPFSADELLNHVRTLLTRTITEANGKEQIQRTTAQKMGLTMMVATW